MSGFLSAPLAPPGSVGNNNHASVGVAPAGMLIAVEFVVEQVGATPQITFKLQGTFDPGQVADGAANWFDLIALPSDNETAAVLSVLNPAVVGAVSRYLSHGGPKAGRVRFVPRVRLVTSANTNVTYRANLRSQYANT
jgi:hypothetical protein